MRLIRAVVRPELVATIVEDLDRLGLGAMTKVDVFGRGRQKANIETPIEWDAPLTKFDSVPKTMIMMVVMDDDAQPVVRTILDAARTGGEGDGKIFVSPVDEIYAVRTGATGL